MRAGKLRHRQAGELPFGELIANLVDLAAGEFERQHTVRLDLAADAGPERVDCWSISQGSPRRQYSGRQWIHASAYRNPRLYCPWAHGHQLFFESLDFEASAGEHGQWFYLPSDSDRFDRFLFRTGRNHQTNLCDLGCLHSIERFALEHAFAAGAAAGPLSLTTKSEYPK